MNALRVLLVEDDALLGLLLVDVLEGMGYSVCAIEATEVAAVAAAHSCKPDLMLVDVQLAAGNGIAAVEEILKTGFVPHVFYSGDISGVQVLRPSAVAIQKPFRVPDLARAIECALGRSVPM
jgi:two-component system, response regulator PdtaR